MRLAVASRIGEGARPRALRRLIARTRSLPGDGPCTQPKNEVVTETGAVF